jgi:hypothetical protein
VGGSTIEIDSSGQFVGTNAFTGAVTIGDGITITDDSATVATLNRTTSDGAIIDLQIDGTSVGNIGYGANSVASASGPWIGNDTSGRVVFANNDGGVIPWTDATMDLGNATAQFNRLFVNGGIVFGGDAVNNYLDDYEEGTFTPRLSFTNTNGSITYQTQVGAYTKIGNRVTVNVYLRISNLGGASGDCRISGWPYTPSSASSVYTITPLWLNTTVSGQIFDGDYYMVGLMSPGDATLRPYALSGAGGMNHLNNSHLTNTTDFMVHMSYPV